jgi:hypothetical protein
MNYTSFLQSKSQLSSEAGFEPLWLPDWLFDFQRSLVEWAIRKGRAAIFADCGLGKTPMQLVWAENVVRKTNKPVLLATPIAVGQQTAIEAQKFDIEVLRTRGGWFTGAPAIWITNYEQLHHYDPSQFAGMVCDESSAIKDFKSERKKVVTEFMRRLPYRLLCTATAAPNDHWELGTSSEALGEMGFRDMITTFFKQETSKDYLGWGRTKYRFRGHAEEPFWKWVCSWARSLRMPSDLGFDDDRFKLPELIESTHVVDTVKPRAGMLFTMPAKDMHEERAERRNSIGERCDLAVELALSHDGPSVLWCELNDEGDQLESRLPGSLQVKGSMSDEQKEQNLIAFSSGNLRHLIIKPKIGAWGLNWQHCNNVIVFPSHSYEQYYQLVRRCYRFGQQRPVRVSSIVCEGERGIIPNLQRKQEQCVKMFQSIVAHMRDSMHLESKDYFPEIEELPKWLY